MVDLRPQAINGPISPWWAIFIWTRGGRGVTPLPPLVQIRMAHPEMNKVLRSNISTDPSVGQFITALLLNGDEKCVITASTILYQLIPWIKACLQSQYSETVSMEPKLGKYINYSAGFAAYQKVPLKQTCFLKALMPFEGSFFLLKVIKRSCLRHL